MNRRALTLLVPILMLTSVPARALFTFNEGKDQIFLTATYGITYDSNLYAKADGEGDTNHALTLRADYTRGAGMYGVNAAVWVLATQYIDGAAEDFANPGVMARLIKSKGRLTGSLGGEIARETRSDTDANVRSTSWHYQANLNSRYPISQKTYFTTTTSFDYRDYLENAALYDMSSVSESIDAYYIYTSKLDLLAGYRIRYGEANGGRTHTDQSFTIGATGAIRPKLTGSIRFGLQQRIESGRNAEDYDAFTTMVGLTWSITSRIALNATINKDFSTTATDISVDNEGLIFATNLKFGDKTVVGMNAGLTHSRYLGAAGFGRRDDTYLAGANVSYILNDTFSGMLSYSYLDNHSNFAISSYVRHQLTLSVTGRF